MNKMIHNNLGWQGVVFTLTCLGLFHGEVYGNNYRLYVNEVGATNDEIIADPQGQYDDWIEIYNAADHAIDIGGMYLTDDLDQPTQWSIPNDVPAATTIGVFGYLIVWADRDSGDDGLHANFKLDAEGEQVGLYDRDGVTLIDSLVFGPQTTDISYGPFPDGEGIQLLFLNPTPRGSNSPAFIDFVENPEFSHERGFYDRAINVTIATVTDDAVIYYTTDGSDPIVGKSPSPASTEYTGAISIGSNTSLRAAAIKPGWMPSSIITHTYIFNANGVGGYDSDAMKSMPVYAIVGDPETTFWGPNGIMSHFTDRGIEYERPVSLEILDAQTGLNCQVDCGIRIAGGDYVRARYNVGNNWECNYNKISMKVYFRSIYGDKKLEYPAFALADTDTFKALQLRAGHNDRCNPFINDEWYRRLSKDMGGVAVTGTLANFFLNGSFKSYFNPCQRYHDDFFRDYYDVDTDWDVITHNVGKYGARDGDTDAFETDRSFFMINDMSDPANFALAGERVDIVNLIDYLIIQLYSTNHDWPHNNWTVSRERTPQGKWRFHCWDMEFMEGIYSHPKFTVNDNSVNELRSDSNWRVFFNRLEDNPEFKMLWADRVQKHFFYDGALTQANLTKRFTELQQQISQVLDVDTRILDYFIPGRTPVLLDIFNSEGLFPGQGPDFQVNGLSQHGGTVSSTDTITISQTSGAGTIYYTTDGTDPRAQGSIPGGEPASSILVSDSAIKKAWVPSSDIGTDWRGGSEPFDDSSWTSGSSGVGYEIGSGYGPYIGINVESTMFGSHETCYVRIPFTLDQDKLASYGNLELRVRYDDGFVAYLNGTEVKRVNSPTTPRWDSDASGNHEASSSWDSYDITDSIVALQAGTNILAIHGLNNGTTSSDFLISAELEATDKLAIVDAGLSSSAIEYTSGFNLDQSTQLKSRVLLASGQWSALHEAVYGVGPVAESLRICEIMYHPEGANDLNQEYIELKNIGDSAINVNLVRFTDGIDFTFPDMEIAAGDTVLVVEDLSTFEALYGLSKPVAGQYVGNLDNGGERLKLEDAVGTTIHDFSYRDNWYPVTDGEGYSLTMIDPTHPDPNAWEEKDSWRASVYHDGSPGDDDSGLLPLPGDIVINEVMTHSLGGPDWIELYNASDRSINMGGWYLSDDSENLTKYEIATDTIIESGQYRVFYQDLHFGSSSNDPGRHIPFALSGNGETVYLTSALDGYGMLTSYRQSEKFGAALANVSFGRYYKASTDNFNFVAMESATPGETNSYPKVGPIVINEIMYNPDWPVGGVYNNDEYEYIELLNISSGPVTLYDDVENLPWKFTDGIEYVFPEHPNVVTIPAGGVVLLVKNPDAFSWFYPSVSSNLIFGPYEGWLANDGEEIELGMPADNSSNTSKYIRVDRVNYSDGKHPQDTPGDVDLWPTEADGAGLSLNRIDMQDYGNDVSHWDANVPTPGT